MHLDLSNHYIVPGFIDVHVHGLEGSTRSRAATRSRRWRGAFRGLASPRFARRRSPARPARCARCSPAVARGADDAPAPRARACSTGAPRKQLHQSRIQGRAAARLPSIAARRHAPEGEFTGAEILAEIAAARPDVGILTIAPELDGALDLIRDLVSHGHHVSLGHSGATYDEALAGIDAGARQATHLFNRMTPVGHRQPGLAARYSSTTT